MRVKRERSLYQGDIIESWSCSQTDALTKACECAKSEAEARDNMGYDFIVMVGHARYYGVEPPRPTIEVKVEALS